MNWDECFNCSMKEVPPQVKRAIQRIYASYPPECLPKGICDPMYIMNVIAKELGVGDGMGNFTLPPVVHGPAAAEGGKARE